MDSPIKPNYYQITIEGITFDVMDICDGFDLDLIRGNAVKYTIRAGRKNPDKELEDIDKAIECLQRYRKKILRKKK